MINTKCPGGRGARGHHAGDPGEREAQVRGGLQGLRGESYFFLGLCVGIFVDGCLGFGFGRMQISRFGLSS
jgi:hypothetical protein